MPENKKEDSEDFESGAPLGPIVSDGLEKMVERGSSSLWMVVENMTNGCCFSLGCFCRDSIVDFVRDEYN